VKKGDKPLTAYMIYRGKVYNDLKLELEENGTVATMQEMNKIVAQKWHEMSDEEKKPVSVFLNGIFTV
jgi:hypothetical protein